MPKIVICPTCGVLFDEDKRTESPLLQGSKHCPVCGLHYVVGEAKEVQVKYGEQ